jgi:hypothetical protein
MKRAFTLAALVSVQAIGLAGASTAHADGKGLTMYGLTADQRLIAFRELRPARSREVGEIRLSGDTRLVGIDFRPATGELIGLGDAGGVYAIDPETGSATFKSQLTVNGLPLALRGVSFGVDFNPTVDRLRVVSDAGQNLRVNVDTGATTEDLDLNVGGTLSTGIVGAAYTNNDADPNTATTLFDLDALLDQISIQSPPNNGVLAATGKLGVGAAPDAGFDIYTTLNDAGIAGAARAFAALTTDRSRLHRVNLLTGAVSGGAAFREGDVVIGLAIPPNQ